MSKYTTAAPYVASYVLVKNNDGHIAFVLRSNTDWMNDYYGLPSGKVEKGESFSAGAIGEALEEIGINIHPADLEFTHVMHRFEGRDWVDVYFTARKWQGEPYNAEPHMHSELAWLDPNNLPKNVIPSVEFALQQITAGKKYSEYGWSGTASSR
jgi:ADP-ribose pyrophosphatase YjhB (NUDIX family)